MKPFCDSIAWKIVFDEPLSRDEMIHSAECTNCRNQISEVGRLRRGLSAVTDTPVGEFFAANVMNQIYAQTLQNLNVADRGWPHCVAALRGAAYRFRPFFKYALFSLFFFFPIWAETL